MPYRTNDDRPALIHTDKIDAKFVKGVLTVTLPKKAEVQKAAKKIDVKAACLSS